MRRNLALLAGLAAGVGAGLLLTRMRGRAETAPAFPPAEDDPRSDLRRKLAEAKETSADERDFQAAGMAGETMVEDEPAPRDEWEAMRRRVHAEGRAAAERMRREPS
jgi:hypothetical protein